MLTPGDKILLAGILLTALFLYLVNPGTWVTP